VPLDGDTVPAGVLNLFEKLPVYIPERGAQTPVIWSEHMPMNDRTTNLLSRSGPALAVIGLHVLIIYGLVVSMGIVEVSKFAAPIQAVFIDEPMSEPQEEIKPVKPEIEDLALAEEPMPELQIEEVVAPPTEVASVPSANAIAAAPMQSGGAAQQLKTTNRVEPAYPPTSRRLGEEGTVRLRVLVDENGRPRDVNVVNSSGFERLDRAAIDAVKRWRFVAATDGSKSITAWTQVAITFQLKNTQ
jgi:periplasmic protein TonB